MTIQLSVAYHAELSLTALLASQTRHFRRDGMAMKTTVSSQMMQHALQRLPCNRVTMYVLAATPDRSWHGGTSLCSFRGPLHQLTPSCRHGSVDVCSLFYLLFRELHALSRGFIAPQETASVNTLQKFIVWQFLRQRLRAHHTATTLCRCAHTSSFGHSTTVGLGHPE